MQPNPNKKQNTPDILQHYGNVEETKHARNKVKGMLGEH